MSSGFIRGNAERKEVDLLEILPPDMRGFSTKEQQIEFAEKYEHTTGVFVKYPWETEADRAARREKVHPVAQTTVSGDPLRLKKSLDRVRYQIETLTPDRKDYDTVLRLYAEEANKYEDALRVKRRDYLKIAPQKPKTEEKAPAEAEQKYEAFAKLSERKRKESAEATSDVEFLKLIRDRESVPDIVKIATAKLVKPEIAA